MDGAAGHKPEHFSSAFLRHSFLRNTLKLKAMVETLEQLSSQTSFRFLLLCLSVHCIKLKALLSVVKGVSLPCDPHTFLYFLLL